MSYEYLPKSDKFKLRIKINYSAKKRRLRLIEDFKDMQEMATHVMAHGFMKRNLPSLIASACHDPLEVSAPYGFNLKLIYRRVCRLGLTWDDKVPYDLQETIIRACSFFFYWNT